MKEETPLNELLIWVRRTLPMDLDFPQMIESKIESLLEKEKQAIIDAWVDGNKEFFYDGTEDIVANTYFNNKYNTNG